MKISLINDWHEWFRKEPMSWSELSVITLSAEKDRVSMDWTVEIIILGLGLNLHYVTKAGRKHWAEVIENLR